MLSEKETNSWVKGSYDKLNWAHISFNKLLSEEFIREFADKVNWDKISWRQKLSKDFIIIEKYRKNMLSEKEVREKIMGEEFIDWGEISHYSILSEEFIREFQDKVDWDYISWCQELSEDFIREFSNKVNWNYISWEQNLSEEFIIEFYDKVDWKILNVKQKLTKNLFEKTNSEQKLYIIMNYRSIWSKYVNREISYK